MCALKHFQGQDSNVLSTELVMYSNAAMTTLG